MNWIQRIGNYAYSVYFNLRYLPWQQAKQIPILINPFVRIGKLHRGDIILKGEIRRAMISWGFQGVEGRGVRKTLISVHEGGKIILNGNAIILGGTVMVIKNAKLCIGNKFLCNSDGFFHVTRDVTIGDDCLLGWNVQFNTTDGHPVWVDGQEKDISGPISIGNHVWIGADNLIFKNAEIPDGCVVAQRSLVSRKFDQPNCLIGGLPAKKIKDSYHWKS
jgi:acetyltransferase-like isoleucine patch superfamily enzyme